MKDLSAYSLTHAEILEGREGVEMLALAMFFGATSDLAYQGNQERLNQLSEEAITYEGRAEVVEEEVARRKASSPGRDESGDEEARPGQPRLL